VRELVARGYVLRGGARSGAAGARALYGVDGAKARALFGGLAAAWEQAPIDARWDFARNQLIPHRVGVALDVEASVEALALALARGEPRVEAVARVVYPAARVDEGLLVGWSPTTLMGTLKTKYDAKKKDRSHNLALASSLLDGVILMPGQTVSYNEVVGERTLARGFREAPVIVHGEMLEGVGGGACQVSSTLYAVSLLTGLDIIERSSHSLPSPYIEKGLDAVVSWPHLDLKLKNSYPFPVAVKARLVENHVVVSLWGSEPPRKVVIRREVVEKLRFVERVEVTTELAPKQTKKVREGHFGYRISKGRITWEGETERFERMYEDVYLPRPRQVKIGPGTLYPDGGARAGASAGNDDALSVED
jgi:vancomycin resistance protein YoaR